MERINTKSRETDHDSIREHTVFMIRISFLKGSPTGPKFNFATYIYFLIRSVYDFYMSPAYKSLKTLLRTGMIEEHVRVPCVQNISCRILKLRSTEAAL